MAQKYVGLDLGTHEVKAVLLSAGMRAVQILEVIVEPVASRAVTGGDEAVGAALEVGLGIIRRRGWNHYPVGVALPGAAASFRVLKFPFADSRRIAQAIAFEAEGQFPIPLDLRARKDRVQPQQAVLDAAARRREGADCAPSRASLPFGAAFHTPLLSKARWREPRR